MAAKLSIVNQTPRQMLIDHIVHKLRVWSYEPETHGLEREDFRLSSRTRLSRPVPVYSRRAIERAMSHILDGAKPGTYAGAMETYANAMYERFAGFDTFV